MAWRPCELIVEGALSFGRDGTVKGIATFNGVDRDVKFDLTGAPVGLQGMMLRFHSADAGPERIVSETDRRPAAEYMEGFSIMQRGEVDYIVVYQRTYNGNGGEEADEGWGGITLAWDSEDNGRVCVEFTPSWYELEEVGVSVA